MRLVVMIFAELTFGICTCSIEVAQYDAPHAVGCFDVGNRTLHHEFRTSVGIDGPLMPGFGNRERIWHAVAGAGAGEHEGLNATLACCLQQVEGPRSIVPIILSWVSDGLTDIGEGGEVHDGSGLMSYDQFVSWV